MSYGIDIVSDWMLDSFNQSLCSKTPCGIILVDTLTSCAYKVVARRTNGYNKILLLYMCMYNFMNSGESEAAIYLANVVTTVA